TQSVLLGSGSACRIRWAKSSRSSVTTTTCPLAMPTNLLAYGDCGLLLASALMRAASSRLSSCTVLAADMGSPSVGLGTRCAGNYDSMKVAEYPAPRCRMFASWNGHNAEHRFVGTRNPAEHR